MKIAIIDSVDAFSREQFDFLIDQLTVDEPLVIMINSPGGPFPGHRESFLDMNLRLVEAQLLLAESAKRVREELARINPTLEYRKSIKEELIDLGRQMSFPVFPHYKVSQAKKRNHKRTGHHAARDRIICKDAYTRSRK